MRDQLDGFVLRGNLKSPSLLFLLSFHFLLSSCLRFCLRERVGERRMDGSTIVNEGILSKSSKQRNNIFIRSFVISSPSPRSIVQRFLLTCQLNLEEHKDSGNVLWLYDSSMRVVDFLAQKFELESQLFLFFLLFLSDVISIVGWNTFLSA